MEKSVRSRFAAIFAAKRILAGLIREKIAGQPIHEGGVCNQVWNF
jgi:hypothetical protein